MSNAGRDREMSSKLAIDVAAMSDAHHRQDARVVVDLVDDPVVTDAHAVAFEPRKLLHTRRARILGERCESGGDPVEQARRQALQVALC